MEYKDYDDSSKLIMKIASASISPQHEKFEEESLSGRLKHTYFSACVIDIN